MTIPHSHASAPTGVVFSKQACLSGFLLVWLIKCGDLGFLLRSKYSFFLPGMEHREETAARMKSCFLCLLQCQGCCRATNSPAHCGVQGYCTTLTVADTAGLRSAAALLCLQGTSPFAHMQSSIWSEGHLQKAGLHLQGDK